VQQGKRWGRYNCKIRANPPVSTEFILQNQSVTDIHRVPGRRFWNCCCDDVTGEIIIQHHMQMPALRLIAFAVLAVCGTLGHAVGLGAIRVQSGLGQPLRATIPLFGGNNNDVGDTCVKARLESIDGVFIVAPKVSLVRGASTSSLALSSLHEVNEPAVRVAIEIGCATPIQRSYQVLLDPPLLQPLLAQVQQPVQADAATHDGRPEARFPQGAGDAPSAASLAPWNEKYLLRKKVRANSGKPRGAAERSALAHGLSGSMTRDVLKISDDSIGAGAHLRLSDSLSESMIAADPAKAEEIRAAQQRFAALLRGEDPITVAEDKARTAQARVQALQAETAAKSSLQTTSNKASLDAMRQHSFTSTFVFSLGGLLLLSLGAVGWLGWRLRSNKASSKSGWWENNVSLASEVEINEKRPPSLQELAPSVAVQAPEAAAAVGLADNDQGFEEFIPQHPAPETLNTLAAAQPLQESPKNIAINHYSVKVASLKVEEISDVTQEAEFWMSLNDPQRALEILETQSDVERPVSPVPWLYLLDLYRETANRAKYDALRARVKRLFNALIPEFDEPKEGNPRTLEDFPHLMNRITDLWGGPESLSFLESLLVDDRDGARVGFELPVYRDILLLIGIATECKHSGSGEPLLSGIEQQDYLIPEEIPALDIDADLPDIAVPEIVPPVGRETNSENQFLLNDINFEPMDFTADITPKSK
jgi:pilus assembly protein FimV